MPQPIDHRLARFASASPPPGLGDIEDAVLARIGAAAPARSGGVAGAIGIAVALGLGIGGGMFGAGAAPASAAPIGMESAFAPSTLLLGR